MTNAIYLSLLAVVAVGVTACNTMAGMGEDVQAGGKAVEREANDLNK